MVGFTWPDGQPTQPQNVLVKFHDPRVGRISRVSVEGDAEAVPIEPVTAKFYGREGVTLQRTQLPLHPCWAATIHKVQGLSLDAAVIDLGPKVFEDGMAYVALNRVRTLDGVAIIDLVSSKINNIITFSLIEKYLLLSPKNQKVAITYIQNRNMDTAP